MLASVQMSGMQGFVLLLSREGARKLEKSFKSVKTSRIVAADCQAFSGFFDGHDSTIIFSR